MGTRTTGKQGEPEEKKQGMVPGYAMAGSKTSRGRKSGTAGTTAKS